MNKQRVCSCTDDKKVPIFGAHAYTQNQKTILHSDVR